MFFTDLVLVIYKKQDFSVVLVHQRQQERLKYRLRYVRWCDVTLPSKNRIENMECGQA